MTPLTEALVQFYATYSDADLDELNQLYEDQAIFEDPLHRIVGVDELRRYFESGRQGLKYCRFEFHEVIEYPGGATLRWAMHFAHRKLNSAETIQVDGCSVLTYDTVVQRVSMHRDYFDLGQMVYEHIPVLGGVMKRIKRRLSE